MISKLNQLEDRKATLAKFMESLNAQAEKDGRDTLNADEQKQFDASLADIKEIDVEIDRQKKLREVQKSLKSVPDANVEAQKKAEEAHKPKPDVIEFSRLSTPKYFKGPNAKEQAYRAGKWYLAHIFGNQSAKLWCERNGVQSLTQIEGANEKGGVFVPDEISSQIIDLRETYGVFRQNAQVVPMGSDTLLIPRRAGGVTAYFVGEGATITDSDAAWNMVQLTAQKLATLTKISSELDEDSVIPLADMLTREIAYAFALKEDQSGFIGDGTSTYGGNVGVVTKVNDGNHAGSIAQAVSGNTTFATLDLDDFVAAMGKLPEYATPNAKWYISKAGYAASMQRLENAAGGITATEVANGVPQRMFQGYPVVISQVLNSTLTSNANNIAALFGDLAMAATLGDRRGLRVETSSDRYFEQDVIAIKGTERVAINVHDVGDGTNAGPIIGLKFAAS